MKININVKSAASAYVLVKGDKNVSKFSSYSCMESQPFYNKYILLVVVCQHKVKSANEDLIITFKKLVKEGLNRVNL